MFLGVASVMFLSGCQSKIFDIFFSSVPAAYLTHLILHTFMIHISFTNSFVIFRTEFHKPSSSSSLVIRIQPQPKELAHPPSSYFTSNRNVTLIMLNIFFIACYCVSFRGLKGSCASRASASHFRVTAMLLSLIVGNYQFWRSDVSVKIL